MLLLQCEDAADESKLKSAGLLPMTEHNLQFGNMTSLLAPILIFSLSILTILLNILPAEIAFAAAAFFIYLQKPTILHNLAQAVNWQVIVLIASMIPLGDALIHTGAAQMLANGLLILTALLPPMGSIALVMCTTILLSSFINNAATAILVAPIAISIANNTGIPVDAVLMATAIGASAAFLTPIAHQNNLLVMEPGNYRFIDFLILGAPLELIIIVISCPLISYFWA